MGYVVTHQEIQSPPLVRWEYTPDEDIGGPPVPIIAELKLPAQHRAMLRTNADCPLHLLPA